MVKNKSDLNNLSETFDILDKESEKDETVCLDLFTGRRNRKKKINVDLSNLENMLNKIDTNDDIIEIRIEVTIGGKTMGSRMNWSKAGISNCEIIENKSGTSNAIHNSYEGVCSYCGKTVDPKHGLLEMIKGKWSVIHPKCAIKRTKERKK